MSFQMFTQLFDTIDKATATYVTEISSKAVATITPFVSVGLTISFIVYGLLIMRSAIDIPLPRFLSRCLQVSIITSFALTAGLYQPETATVITKMPHDLSAVLIKSPNDNKQLTNLIDKVTKKEFESASTAFKEAAFLNTDRLLYSLFGILILLATSFLTAIEWCIHHSHKNRICASDRIWTIPHHCLVLATNLSVFRKMGNSNSKLYNLLDTSSNHI